MGEKFTFGPACIVRILIQYERLTDNAHFVIVICNKFVIYLTDFVKNKNKLKIYTRLEVT